MKKSFYIFSILFLFSGFILAQSGQKTIIEDINMPKSEQGDVKVLLDETVQDALAGYRTNNDSSKIRSSSDQSSTGVSKSRIYRIQVFSGNDQKRSRREGESKQAMVRSAFPGTETYLTFDAPFWRVRAGNYQSREEADAALKEMKRALPSFGREMYVVQLSR